MKVLITGCNGYLGRHISERLNSLNYDVFGIDLVKGHDNIIEQVEGDFVENNDFQSKMCEADWIIHLAAIPGISSAEKNPEACIDLNVNKLSRLLNLVKVNNPSLYFSFISTYDIFDEKNNALIGIDQINTIYHYSKYCGELLCELFRRQHGLKVGILRPATFFGAYDRLGSRVLDIFITAALSGRPIQVNNPNQILTFTSIQEISSTLMSQFHLSLDELSHSISKNLVAAERYSLLELATLIKSQLNSDSEIVCEKELISHKFLTEKLTPKTPLLNFNTPVLLKDWLETLR